MNGTILTVQSMTIDDGAECQMSLRTSYGPGERGKVVMKILIFILICPPVKKDQLNYISNPKIFSIMSSCSSASNQLQAHKESNPLPPTLTTSNGSPINSITASLTVGKINNTGATGPIALQDFTLIDHLSHFDRERIPERVVHAKGSGAFGYFEVTKSDIQKYCKADIFNRVGKCTPVAGKSVGT